MSGRSTEPAGTTAWAPRIMFAPSTPATASAREFGDRRQIARSLEHRLDFEEQTLGYSLLRPTGPKGAGPLHPTGRATVPAKPEAPA